MIPLGRRGIILIEPDINPVARRFSLPNIANYPPLPQVRLAGQLPPGEHVEIADLRIAGERERLLERVRRYPPALVGISLTFTSNGDEATDVAAAIRTLSPDTTIVFGGTAPSEDPASFWDSAADLICHRNGDASFAALAVEVCEAGRTPARFPGFFHRADGRWILDPGPAPTPLANLRPNPWHLLPRRYWREYFQGFRPTGMGQTSEGCPYDCTFCTVWKTHGRKVSLASLANVRHDFDSLPGSVRAFFFADDIWLQASEKQIQELHDPLLEWMSDDFLRRRPDFWLTVETRTDLYLREEDRFKAWIKRGGLKRILFGVEAVTDEQLKNFSKRNTVDRNIEAIRRAAESGATVTAQFVIPCDATRAYFDEMVRFLEAHRRWIRSSNFTIATPLPGTDLYTESLKESPELADRSAISHPAFSLFTALTPTHLDIREFYEQVARVFRAANQIRYSREARQQLFKMVHQSPWLIRRLARAPLALRALTNPGTFLDVHRQVQGDRLLGPRPASGWAPAISALQRSDSGATSSS